MILRILSVLLLTLVASDFYLHHLFMRGKRPVWAQVLFLLPNATLLLLAVVLAFTETLSPGNMNIIMVFFVLYMLIALPKFVFVMLHLMGRTICYKHKEWRWVNTLVSGLFSIVVLGALIYGYMRGFNRLSVHHIEYESVRLPESFDNYRVVQFTDVHLSSMQHRPWLLQQLVRQINALHPDLIVFTGDLVSIDVSELTAQARDVLSELHAPDGVLSVLGNHDYMTYARYLTPAQQAEHLDSLKALQKEMGWQLLLNEHKVIKHMDDSIVVCGVENDGTPPFPALGDLDAALYPMSARGKEFKILLSHDPSHWRRKVLPDSNIDLTLSGHTHGMQFSIGGWSPAQYIYPEWGDIYYEGSRALNVSLGLGGALIPFRLGAWAEVDVITLRTSSQK